MRVSPRKDNWLDYSSNFKMKRIPRLMFVALSRPVSTFKKGHFLLKERAAYKRLLGTSAGLALALVTEENNKLDTTTGQYDDIWRLYSLSKNLKANVVWEYGPGWTTVGLAAGMIDAGIEGTVYALEGNEEWYNWYNDIFEKLDPRFKERIKLLHSPTIITDDYDERTARHTIRPKEMPDLVHIDGCSNVEKLQVCCDIVDIEEQLPNKCTVVFDGRVQNVKFLQRNVKRSTSLLKQLFRDPMVQAVLTITK